ncbi:DUF7210 family protein [Zestomonas carbonaria]|uniref:DUF7210 domain-containing protein n=1 Tax=Zestomonas carbonaria TaxID=2762745 RepID=A0A7U7ELU9_9GAMM|nr:hypothetical protein [Pseudomonas carbonaria]CAD5107236.1 hypothetical protein PSEWESI4_01507 [Pseudomonas carbonaria]
MSSKTDAQAAVPKLETVTLLQAHTHAGVDYAKGDTIEVTATEKEWLIRHETVAGQAGTQPAAAKAKE